MTFFTPSGEPMMFNILIVFAPRCFRNEMAAAALAKDEGIGLFTPSEASELATYEARSGARGNLITLGIMTAILCLCMYFIMRANLLNRVREVGICRAIGVTKGNLVFRFLIEALVLCGTTVFVGFALSSFVMRSEAHGDLL